MSTKKFEPPRALKDATFLSGEAGRIFGVAQRTVQAWTERGLVIPMSGEPSGSGDKRRYSVLNCIEIGLIQALKDTLKLGDIAKVMQLLREKGRPLTLEEALADPNPCLIIRFYETWPIGVSCVSRERFGPPSGIEQETRRFHKFWEDTTLPDDKSGESDKHVKTLLVRLEYVRERVLAKLA